MDATRGRCVQGGPPARRRGQQLVQEHSQAVDVAPSIDVNTRKCRLFRTHISGVPISISKAVKTVLSVSRWPVVAVSLTTVTGLLLGLGFSLWQSERPYRERPVSSLIADLQKTDSAFNLFHQKLWPLLPDRLQAGMGGRFAPVPAKRVRLEAAAELRSREPAPTNALPVLRLLLRDLDMDMRRGALDTLQGIGTAAHSLAPDVIM